MHVAVLGLNHKSAPLHLQEKVAKACCKAFSLESPLNATLSCVVLQTCNRTEIYFAADDLSGAHCQILAALREGMDEPFEHRIYTYFGRDCFIHLATVIAGWDSLIVGETQIHRQVKMAYENTKLHYPLRSEMHYLFQKSFKIAKWVRSQMPHTTLSLCDLVWEIGEDVMGSLRAQEMLLVGNSEMNRKILQFAHQRGIGAVTLATRAPHSASDLLRHHKVTICDFSALASLSYDLVVCSTHASQYLIQEEAVGDRVRLIVDLSVPRVVDPLIAAHQDVALWDMERIAETMGKKRQGDLCMPGTLVDQVEKYIALYLRKMELLV